MGRRKNEIYLTSMKCDYCGDRYRTCRYKDTGMILCGKHRGQIEKLGEIRRTKFDKNKILIYDDYAEIVLYDGKGIVKNYDVICIEDLAVKNMVKNHKLAKSIADVSWGEIRRQLTYKTEWHHKSLVVVDRYFPSSQLCECGYKNADVKNLKVRKWVCLKCGMKQDRDVMAAKNILNEGLRMLGA